MKIALVENDELTADVTGTLLKMWGYDCTVYPQVSQGIADYNKDLAQVLWIDYKHNVRHCLELNNISEHKSSIPIIITSTANKERFEAEQYCYVPLFFFQKPYQWDMILKALEVIREIVDSIDSETLKIN